MPPALTSVMSSNETFAFLGQLAICYGIICQHLAAWRAGASSFDNIGVNISYVKREALTSWLAGGKDV